MSPPDRGKRLVSGWIGPQDNDIVDSLIGMMTLIPASEQSMRRMMTAVALLLVSALQMPALAQLAIEPTDGLKHVGKNVRVRFKVVEVGRSGIHFVLNSRDSHKAEDCFIVWLDQDVQSAYKDLGIQLPGHFVRKHVEVVGRIKNIKPGGLVRPAIVVSDPSSIRIVNAPQPRPPGPESILNIKPSDCLKHIGKKVRVRFVVLANGRNGEAYVLNSNKVWDAPESLEIFFGPEVNKVLVQRGVEHPVRHFLEKEIEVTGTVIGIRPGGLRLPAIGLKSADDIRIVDKPASDKPAPGKSYLEIKPEEGLQYVGKRVRVRMVGQLSGRAGARHTLNSGISWDAPGNFQLLFGKEVLAAYAKNGIKLPGQHFLNKPIEVTGLVKENRPGGIPVPVIEVQSIDDVKFVLSSTRKVPSVTELLNRRVDIYLRTGDRIGNVLVTALETGSVPESIVYLKVKIGDARARVYRASAVEDLVVDGVPLDLSYDRKGKVLAVDTEKRKARIKDDDEAERRVLSLGNRFWPRLTDEIHAVWIDKHRKFAKSVQDQFPQLSLRVIESKYYIVVTNVPDREAQKHLGNLDKMYDELCRAFGIPVGSNIWNGKCVVCAFQNQADYIRFEIETMKNAKGNPANSVGNLHPTADGSVILSLYKESTDARFATLLVRQSAKAVMARFRSNVPIPSWLSRGMAVWIAEYVNKTDDEFEISLQNSINAMKAQQTLAGFFESPSIHVDHFGCGAAMVDILIKRDAGQFRQFFTDIKLGLPPEESLKRAYKMTYADLVRLYGRSIGLPDLKP